MAGLFPLSRMQQLDDNGNLLDGARLFLFDGGTTTPRVGYKDSSLTSAHPNPILADAAGRLPLIYLADGFYRQRLTSKAGSVIFDDDGLPVLSSTSGGSGTSVDPDSVYKTRDLKIRFDDHPLDGYVRLNGRTIGSASSGATERANVDTQSLYEELWQFGTITVSGGKGLSAAADFAANKPLVLPNAAGRGLFGMDDMGAGAQGILTTTGFGSEDPTLPGSRGGAQTYTITTSNLPAYTLTGGTGSVSASGTTSAANTDHTHTGSGSGTTSGQSVNHDHLFNQAANTNAAAQSGVGATTWSGAPTLTATTQASVDHSHTFSYSFTTGGQSTNHNHTVTVTGSATNVAVNSGGGGAAFSKVPPAITMMIYIRL